MTLDHLLGLFSSRDLKHVQHALLDALRLGLFQILFLERIPPFVAVDTTVSLARRELGPGAGGFANGILRSVLRALRQFESNEPADSRFGLPCEPNRWALFDRPILPDATAEPVEHLALALGHPRWLVERWIKRFGAEVTEQLCRSNNLPHPIHVRWRSQGAPPSQWQPVSDIPGMHLAPHEGAVVNWPGYADGEFIVQGLASAKAVQFLQVRPGMKVLDLCAAPGTKSLHLADLASPAGRVFAVDKSLWRMRKLKESATRLRIMNVVELVADVTQLGLNRSNRFDRILLDVPCSNTGELARRVEVRHRLRLDDILVLSELQAKMLQTASEFLAPEGLLVYSTCSLEAEEGSEVVHRFLDANESLVLKEERWLLPHEHFGVGGYLARLRRK